LLPDLLDEGKNVHPLKVEIGKDQIGRLLEGQIDGGEGVVDGADFETLLAEGQLHQFLNRKVVIDQEHASRHSPSLLHYPELSRADMRKRCENRTIEAISCQEMAKRNGIPKDLSDLRKGHDRADEILPGEVELRRALSSLQDLLRRLISKLREVVLLTQMGQKKILQLGMKELSEKEGRVAVGKVPLRSRDPLLEVIGIRAVDQHFSVIIRF